MITCNHCRKPTLAGMAHCQNCGWPLTTTIGDGNVPEMAAPEQPELPAWLETLRSGGSATGNTGSSNFSAADLVDEGMLPGWMRPGREENADNTPSGSHPARRPASMPAPNTDNAFTPTRGMPANSLIDEQSLPSWIQGQQEGSPSAGQQGISAASLVQPGALPDWIRSLETQSPTPPSTPPGSVQYPQAGPAQQPISGHELIDQQALPQWMSGQDTSIPARGESGLPASSLLDTQSLPTWLREGSQEQRSQYAVPPQPPAQAGQAPDYQVPIGQGQIPNPNTQNNLAAGSLIDANALPDWMRPNEAQRPGMASHPPQQNPAENPRQASFGVPSRSENMRVPSRPRAEIEYVEESEVAANTFASMLGVASVAPNFPGQQSRDASGPSQPLSQPLQPMPQSQSYGMPPGSAQGQQPLPNQHYGPAQGGTPAGYQMGQMPNNVPGMQPGARMQNDQLNANKKPGKRGFLSTILDWFSFTR